MIDLLPLLRTKAASKGMSIISLFKGTKQSPRPPQASKPAVPPSEVPSSEEHTPLLEEGKDTPFVLEVSVFEQEVYRELYRLEDSLAGLEENLETLKSCQHAFSLATTEAETRERKDSFLRHSRGIYQQIAKIKSELESESKFRLPSKTKKAHKNIIMRLVDGEESDTEQGTPQTFFSKARARLIQLLNEKLKDNIGSFQLVSDSFSELVKAKEQKFLSLILDEEAQDRARREGLDPLKAAQRKFEVEKISLSALDQRKQDMGLLEQEIEATAHLFQEVALLVRVQGQQLSRIEADLITSKNYAFKAEVQLVKGRKKQRRRQCCCFWCSFVGIMLIVIVVLVVVKMVK